MSSSMTYKAVPPANVPTPPSGYYALFISDGTSGTTANAYYKKDSSGALSALIPAAYSDENAQDAVGNALLDGATIDFTYNDAIGTISAERAALTGDVTASFGSNSTVIANDAVTNVKLANMAAITVKGNNASASGDPADLTVTQLETMRNFGIGTRSIIAQIAVSNITTETAYAAFTIPANSLAIGDTIKIRANLNGTRSTTAMTITPRIRVGAVGSGAGGNIAASAGPISTIITAVASTLSIDAVLTVRSIGATGTIIGDINVSGPMTAATTTAAAAITTAVTIDTTQSRDIVLTIALSAAQLTSGTIQIATIARG